MTITELKERARAQLGMLIYGKSWLIAAAVCFVSFVISASVNMLLPVAMIVIGGPLEYGITYLFLEQSRDGAPMYFGDMFCGFTDEFGQSLLISLMRSIYTALWTVLFPPIGWVKTFSYSMAHFIKADNPELGWKDCITMSRKLMDGHKMELFMLHLSFLGWHLLGLLAFGVGIFCSIAYETAAIAQFYNDIRYNQWSELY